MTRKGCKIRPNLISKHALVLFSHGEAMGTLLLHNVGVWSRIATSISLSHSYDDIPSTMG